MDKKAQISVPKFIWVIAAILVLCIIFLLVVQVPFSKNYTKYETDHTSATAQISQYEDYLKRAKDVQANIDSMKKQYEEQSEKLFVNASKTTDDIRAMLKKLDYQFASLSIEKGVADAQGRKSSTGDPLYSTQISLSFTVTKQKFLETLNYFEKQSDGSYYVSNISFAPVDDTNTTTSGTKNASENYTVNMTMNLYYFNAAANTGSGVSGVSGASAASSNA